MARYDYALRDACAGTTFVWPSDKDGTPGGRWGQQQNWLVLDVTAGLDHAVVVHGPVPRPEALTYELNLRTAKS